MPRHSRLFSFAPALICAVAAVALTGCSVLFVPKKPQATPSPTPNTAVHEYPNLEARLPDAVDGHVLEKFSLVSNPEQQIPKTLEVLRLLNKTTDDVQLAKASATNIALNISALRIIGADGARAAATFEQVDEADPNTLATYQPSIVAGKRVLIRTTGTQVAYLYPLDDIVFVVDGNSKLIEPALTAIH